MSKEDLFEVVTTGEILAGFDADAVREQLVRALRLKPEVAANFFERPRVLKKDVSRADADKICAQLAKLGVAATAQGMSAAVASSPPAPISEPEPEPEPAPMKKTATVASELEIVDYESSQPAKDDTITCPNCQHVQAKSEQCEACGIWFHKFEAPSAASERPSMTATVTGMASPAAPTQETAATDTNAAIEAVGNGAFSPAAIAVALVAGLIGAWVWKIVAVSLEVEIGFVAWGIGGAVGFAAASMGSRGVQAGILCGLIALGSIVAGKYWAYSALVDTYMTAFTETVEAEDELYAYYEEDVANAQAYVNGSGSDDFVRRFMAERGFSEHSDPYDISAAELADFREYTEPWLRETAASSPDFEEWNKKFMGEIGDLSPWSIMFQTFGLLDILFAFLGIGTAYRLGSQES
ncbi:MAG: hypothetical protein AAF917_11235 [Pseudomonadota bacterium]